VSQTKTKSSVAKRQGADSTVKVSAGLHIALPHAR